MRRPGRGEKGLGRERCPMGHPTQNKPTAHNTRTLKLTTSLPTGAQVPEKVERREPRIQVARESEKRCVGIHNNRKKGK